MNTLDNTFNMNQTTIQQSDCQPDQTNEPRFYANSAMTSEELQQLWTTLQNKDNKPFEEIIKAIQDQIKNPYYIYRYRSINKSTLDALLNNKLYFSRADYYDDPFDTFLYIDFKKLKSRKIMSSIKPSIVESFCKTPLPSSLQCNFKTKRMLAESFDVYMKQQAYTALQSFIYSICFSSDYLNESLWLKYANQHKGFVLEYPSLCFSNDVSTRHTVPYPIFYTDEPYTISDEIATNLYFGLYQKADQAPKFRLGEVELISLTKKRVHHYDNEWRIICSDKLPKKDSAPQPLNITPTKVILGLRISRVDLISIISIAQVAGIKQIDQVYINDSNHLSTKCFMFYNESTGRYELTRYGVIKAKTLNINIKAILQ